MQSWQFCGIPCGTSADWISLCVNFSLMLISSEHYITEEQLAGREVSLKTLLVYISIYSILFCHQLLISVWQIIDNYLHSAPAFPNHFLLKGSCLLKTVLVCESHSSICSSCSSVLSKEFGQQLLLKARMPPTSSRKKFWYNTVWMKSSDVTTPATNFAHVK